MSLSHFNIIIVNSLSSMAMLLVIYLYAVARINLQKNSFNTPEYSHVLRDLINLYHGDKHSESTKSYTNFQIELTGSL